MLASKFFHIDGTKADFKLNKSICDTKFIVYFRGHNGHQGHKGQNLGVFFFFSPQAHATLSRHLRAWKLRVGNALVLQVRELQETRFL